MKAAIKEAGLQSVVDNIKHSDVIIEMLVENYNDDFHATIVEELEGASMNEDKDLEQLLEWFLCKFYKYG